MDNGDLRRPPVLNARPRAGGFIPWVCAFISSATAVNRRQYMHPVHVFVCLLLYAIRANHETKKRQLAVSIRLKLVSVLVKPCDAAVSTSPNASAIGTAALAGSALIAGFAVAITLIFDRQHLSVRRACPEIGGE